MNYCYNSNITALLLGFRYIWLILGLLGIHDVRVECQSILYTEPLKSLDMEQVISAVKHPSSDNAILALLGNSSLAEISLESFSLNCLTFQEGYVDGPLVDSMFKKPTEMIKLENDNYAVSDTYNHCIRKIDWKEKRTETIYGWFSCFNIMYYCSISNLRKL